MSNPTAKRALEKFDDSTSILLIVGRDNSSNPDVNEAIYTHFERSTKLDGKAFKLWRKIAKQFPQHEAAINVVLAQAAELITAAKAEADAEKAAKAARIAARAEKAKNVTKHGAPLGKVSREAFETLAEILAPVRAQYALRAKELATAYVGTIKQKIANAGSFDAAFPNLPYAQDRHGIALEQRAQAAKITRNPAQYIALRVEAAEFEVDSFVVKLAEKIGAPVAIGTVTGNLWDNSHLTVTTRKGESQQWVTRCILNVSVLGKVFNQWPTRQVS